MRRRFRGFWPRRVDTGKLSADIVTDLRRNPWFPTLRSQSLIVSIAQIQSVRLARVRRGFIAIESPAHSVT